MKTPLVWTAFLIALAAFLAWADPSPAADEPAGQPATAPADAEATADEIIRSLLMERPKATVLPTEAPATEPASQPSTVAPTAMLKPLETAPGAVIVNRLGRLVKDPSTEWWTFHFESEGSSRILREPPLRILPNRQLEAMEETSQGGTRPGLRFRVSGEVTEYRQSKYLLLRNWMVERDMGQL